MFFSAVGGERMRALTLSVAVMIAAGSASAVQAQQGYQHMVPMQNGQYRYYAPTYQGLDPRKDDLTGMADVLGEALDRRCTTNLCFETEEMIDKGQMGLGAVNRNAPRNVAACSRANQDIGMEIGRINHIITSNEESVGGQITYENSRALRALLFNETYFLRQRLRDIAPIGDASQCFAMRNHAFYVMRDLMKTRLPAALRPVSTR